MLGIFLRGAAGPREPLYLLSIPSITISATEDHFDIMDNNRSRSDDENNNNRNDATQQQQSFAKNHPYLPTALPLFPEQWITTNSNRATTQRTNRRVREENDDERSFFVDDVDEYSEIEYCGNISTTHQLAVYEIDDIILFPGATLPLRLRDPNWVSYLKSLIDNARKLSYAAQQYNEDGTTTTIQQRMGEARLVILPRVNYETRRTRRRRRRPRRNSFAVVERRPDDRENQMEERRVPMMGRWRVDLIRRGVVPSSRTRRSSSTRVSSERNNPRRSETNDESVDQSSSDDDGESDMFRPVRPAARSALSNDNPLIGRVGTMATITFTHEEVVEATFANSEAHVSSGTSNGHHSLPSEVILTVLGTQRCRLIHSVKDNKKKANLTNVQIPMYFVETINDGSATLPPSWMLQPTGGNFRCSITTPSEEGDRTELVGSNSCALRSCSSSAIRNLSIRSSTPAIAYQALWPWRLCHQIINLIQEDQFQGLRDILPLAAGLCYNQSSSSYDETTSIASLSPFQVLDPTSFSNWISSNMPLSRDDSLDLLEMTCTVQQLKFLNSILKDKKEELILLRCKHCGAPISQMKHVFSVTGTSGTAGNYVNAYGVNHQTITLRSVDYDVLCVGQPETKESWFPGYSWQIAHCPICFEHLGWKYQSVGIKDDDEKSHPDDNMPDTFWGFSCVTTDEHVQPRRL